MALLALLYTLAVCGVLFYVLFWALNTINPPEPWKKLILVVLVFATVWIIFEIFTGSFILPVPTLKV